MGRLCTTRIVYLTIGILVLYLFFYFYHENIHMKDDGRFQGKVYFEKVISINEDEQITSGIPISCGPGDFTVTSEFEIEDAEYTNESLQKQIVASKASFKLFDRK